MKNHFATAVILLQLRNLIPRVNKFIGKASHPLNCFTYPFFQSASYLKIDHIYSSSFVSAINRGSILIFLYFRLSKSIRLVIHLQNFIAIEYHLMYFLQDQMQALRVMNLF